jgi:phage terminase large subunit
MVMNANPVVLNIERLRAQRKSYPLSMWRAWDRAMPRTSQRRALQCLGTEITALFGGNRSGKTALALALVVAFALGRDHPAVRIWCRINGVDPETIPKGPGKIYLLALTSNDSLSYHREPIAALLPREGCRWWNRNYRGEARVRIEVPGYDEPAEIWFKSVEQGRKALQGASVRAVFFDEEPDKDVFEEAEMRVLDEQGRIFLSMTPLKGMTWVYDDLASKPNTPERQCHWIHTKDNPWHRNAARLESVFGKMGDAVQAARSEGRFVSLQGLVFAEWNREVHLQPRREIPEHWPRFRAIDFGTRNPTAILWGAVDDDGVLYIYREHYEAEKTLEHHAQVMLDHPEPIEMTWADPKHPQLMLDLIETWNIDCVKANKAVRKGINRVRERLLGTMVGDNYRPDIVVFDDLVHFLREIEGYVWDPNASRKADGKEQPRKKDDHLMDCFRYLVMGVDDGAEVAAA